MNADKRGYLVWSAFIRARSGPRPINWIHPNSICEIASERVMCAANAHEYRTRERRVIFDFDFNIWEQAERREMLNRGGRFERDARDGRGGVWRALGERFRRASCFAARAGNRIAVWTSVQLAQLRGDGRFGFGRKRMFQLVRLRVCARQIETKHIGEMSFGEPVPSQQRARACASGVGERESMIRV